MIYDKLIFKISTTLAKTIGLAIAIGLISHSVAYAEDGYQLPRPVPSAEFPFDSRFVGVLDSEIHYVEIYAVENGEGRPIVFVHGNPTSSYLWRNIIPHVEPYGRAIALDLIGMGQSGKPDIDYTFDQHYVYFEAFIEQLGLTDITFVIHDWGAALGFEYARNHPDNVVSIAFMEGALPPAFPAPTFESLGEQAAELFRLFKDPVLGPELIINQNFFVEEVLPSAINRPLSDVEMDYYRAPYLIPSTRKPLFVWPQEVPIEGNPPRMVKKINKISKFMQHTEIPTLLLYASPGILVPPEQVSWYTDNMQNIETVFVGQGLHFIQEDQPEAIGRAIADWLRRHDDEDKDDDD